MRTALLLIALLILRLPSYAARSMTTLMELPPFERAVLVIKHYETLHKPHHWPFIGYGHQVQPGEPYRKGIQLTEPQADALLRQDLRKLCTLYRSYGSDSLLLACISYNCGPKKVMQSRFIKKLAAGERDVYEDYLSFCRYKGKVHQGIRRRRWVEYWVLKGE